MSERKCHWMRPWDTAVAHMDSDESDKEQASPAHSHIEHSNIARPKSHKTDVRMQQFIDNSLESLSRAMRELKLDINSIIAALREKPHNARPHNAEPT